MVCIFFDYFFFFFSSRRRHTRYWRDWSSDVCSSDLINPLVETPKGELFALDAKISVDDNALFRQSEIVAFYDPTQLSPMEARSEERRVGKECRLWLMTSH